MVSRMDAAATEEVSPSEPSGDTFELPETPDSLALDAMEAAMRSVLPGREDDEEAEEEDLDLDDEESDAEDEEYEEPDAELEPLDDQDEAEPGEPQGKSVDEWVEVLSKDGIQRFSEVPRKVLKDVLPKYVEHEKRQVVTDAALITRAQLEGQLQWLKWTMNVDRQFEDDPDAKLTWLEGGSPEAQQYQQWKRVIEHEPTPESRAQTEQSQRLNQMMQKQVSRLQEYPELQQELLQKHRTAPYATDMDGLERLTDDVADLLVRGVEQTVSKKQEPAKKKVQARKANSASRREVPRPDVSRGRTAARGGTDIENITDPNELIAMGINGVLNKR